MPRSDAEIIADEALCMKLLAGYHRDGARDQVSYLKQNSYEERCAREALGRMVRDGMRGFVGELLALAIDPRMPSRIPGMKPTRRIRFESPSRGKPSTWARDLLVVDLIRRTRFNSDSGKLEAAITTAVERFGISRSAVQAIWARHEKLLGRRKASK